MGLRVLVVMLIASCGRINFDLNDAQAVGPIATFSAHGSHTCVVTTVGEAWCWGRGDSGETDGTGIVARQITPVRVPNVPRFDMISLGEFTTFARTPTGELWAWGKNESAQLGLGAYTPFEAPRANALTDVEQIAASQYFTCARLRDGTLSCWGDNGCGELGDGTQNHRVAPGLVAGITSTRTMGAHDVYTCASDDAAVRCFGAPIQATPCAPSTPTIAAGVPPLLQVQGGCHYTMCGVDAGGGVWCEGEGAAGQLGNGGVQASTTFVAVAGFGGANPHAVDVSVGAYFACARSADHHVWCWGTNTNGPLGLGDASTPFSTTPLPLPFFDGSIAIDDLDSGCSHSCVRSSGTLYCWGANEFGQIGDGTTDARYGPVPITL